MFFDEEDIDRVDEYVSKFLYSFGYTWVDVNTGERFNGEDWFLGYCFDDELDDEPLRDFEIKMKNQLIKEEKFTKEKAIDAIKEASETGFDLEWQLEILEYRNVNEARNALESFERDEPIRTASVACLQSAWLKHHFDIS